MLLQECLARLDAGALTNYSGLYADTAAQTERYRAALLRFAELYGADRDVYLFSVPGRSEICGNHTDHNHGCVLAGAIDRDIIAIASPNEDGVIRLQSEGYPEDCIDLSLCDDPACWESFTSSALIAGTCRGFAERDLSIGGFDAYTTTEVLKGSGLSSSAAFEVMVGNILSHLYNDGTVSPVELAKIAQFAENVYFGKPCGLMDQMACAVGGFVFIDFADPAAPCVEPLSFSLTEAGYALCIVNTGGNHADLNADYASIPAEMKRVAAYFGRDTLRGISESTLLANLPVLRTVAGDRALLRALHFCRENGRVEEMRAALQAGDVAAFLAIVLRSGQSSFTYLQNVYTNICVEEQGLSVALAVTEGLLAGRGCAWRVHGGGFAGTIQAFVKRELVADYTAAMDAFFGAGACMPLQIRGAGAIAISL